MANLFFGIYDILTIVVIHVIKDEFIFLLFWGKDSDHDLLLQTADWDYVGSRHLPIKNLVIE